MYMRMYHFVVYLIGMCSVFTLVSHTTVATVYGASFLFEPLTADIGVGEEIEVIVQFDAKDTTINAISGEVVVPQEHIDIVAIDTGNSFIPIWIERPALNEAETIIFSGIIPGGFRGMIDPSTSAEYMPAELFRMIVRGSSVGTGAVAFGDRELFLHDGAGTQATSSATALTFQVEGINDTRIVRNDITPPEPFTVSLERDEVLFGNRYFIVFNAQDKQSGVRYYEVQEGGGKWQQTESPYELKDQSRTNRVLVKAVDGAGNVRIVEAVPGKESHRDTWILGIGSLLLLFGCLWLYYRRQHKHHV